MKTEFVVDARPGTQFAPDAFQAVVGHETQLRTPFGTWPATIVAVDVADDGRSATFAVESAAVWMAPTRVGAVSLGRDRGQVTLSGDVGSAVEHAAASLWEGQYPMGSGQGG